MLCDRIDRALLNHAEELAPALSFRSQAAWWIKEMIAGRIVNAKKREPIDPNTISFYQTALAYLNEQIGDTLLASINNPEAKTLIAKMVSERTDDGKRRFSDRTVVEYFRVLRKVIASVLDEKFNPVHHREWNLAAICLPRVNPKRQCRPTFTPKENDDAAVEGRRSVPCVLYLLRRYGAARVRGHST
jgi:hypothetical protein